MTLSLIAIAVDDGDVVDDADNHYMKDKELNEMNGRLNGEKIYLK